MLILKETLRDLARSSAEQTVRRLRLSRSRVRKPQPTVCRSSPPTCAIQWIHANERPDGGVYVDSGHYDAYPEVTGYLIPTLLRYGQNEQAARLTRWLLRIQRRDGSYASPIGEPHVFDTGQVLRGLLAAAGLVPDAVDACRRAAAWLHAEMIDGGSGGFAVDSTWMKRYSRSIPVSAHLYVLPAMRDASTALQEPKYQKGADRCLEYYLEHKGALQIGTLTHFLGYELEALIDLGRTEAAIPLLGALRRLQREDGSVRGKGGVSWVCTPGLAQLAVCWYKIGDRVPADRAMNWLERHQMPSGGFLGSYGAGATYFPNVEIPWAVKFYLDANLLRGELVLRT